MLPAHVKSGIEMTGVYVSDARCWALFCMKQYKVLQPISKFFFSSDGLTLYSIRRDEVLRHDAASHSGARQQERLGSCDCYMFVTKELSLNECSLSKYVIIWQPIHCYETHESNAIVVLENPNPFFFLTQINLGRSCFRTAICALPTGMDSLSPCRPVTLTSSSQDRAFDRFSSFSVASIPRPSHHP